MTADLGPATVLRPAGHVAVVVSGHGERVSMQDLDHLEEPVRILEGTAAVVWEALDGTRTVADVVTELAAAYDVAPAVIEADVLPMLTELVATGYLDSV